MFQYSPGPYQNAESLSPISPGNSTKTQMRVKDEAVWYKNKLSDHRGENPRRGYQSQRPPPSPVHPLPPHTSCCLDLSIVSAKSFPLLPLDLCIPTAPRLTQGHTYYFSMGLQQWPPNGTLSPLTSHYYPKNAELSPLKRKNNLTMSLKTSCKFLAVFRKNTEAHLHAARPFKHDLSFPKGLILLHSSMTHSHLQQKRKISAFTRPCISLALPRASQYLSTTSGNLFLLSLT